MQKSVETKHRQLSSNFPGLFSEIQRYCCPVEIIHFNFYMNEINI